MNVCLGHSAVGGDRLIELRLRSSPLLFEVGVGALLGTPPGWSSRVRHTLSIAFSVVLLARLLSPGIGSLHPIWRLRNVHSGPPSDAGESANFRLFLLWVRLMTFSSLVLLVSAALGGPFFSKGLSFYVVLTSRMVSNRVFISFGLVKSPTLSQNRPLRSKLFLFWSGSFFTPRVVFRVVGNSFRFFVIFLSSTGHRNPWRHV